ncbi:MAG TPA: hypothetical protein PKC45_14785 [Gemmatales bacterium]|nr:hypothetical protein [Gemmatales bacterium]
MPEVGFAYQMGAVVAGVVGAALLALAAGKGGTLARRGERPGWVGVVFGVVAALGGLTAVSGFVAGGLNQPSSVWMGPVAVGGVLIFLAWGMNRHIRALRAEASGQSIAVPGKDDVGR